MSASEYPLLGWDLLEILEAPADELRVREIENIKITAGQILIGLDALGHRHLLIPVDPGTRIIEDRRSNGVQITSHPLLDRNKLRLFVDLVCLKPHLHELFSIIIGEVLELLKSDDSRPDLTCRKVLDQWRELLEREFVGQVRIEKLVGLFGELWHLREVVRCDPNAVYCWTGPRGRRHDLSTNRVALEVKASLSSQGRFFEIHGHEQLEPPINGRLYLAAMKLVQVPASGESLQEIVESIVILGGDRNTLLALLIQTGIGNNELNRSKNIRFSVVENRVYEVGEGFPRIISASFTYGSLPSGVVKLTYQIDLSTEPPYPLDKNAVGKLYASMATGGDVS